MVSKLDVVKAREALKPRREPHWHRLAKGQFLGFRKMDRAAVGTWVARWRDDVTGKQSHQALGDFVGNPASERFDLAKKAAEEWFKQLDGGQSKKVGTTVRQACAAYVKNLREGEQRREATAIDAEGRFRRWVDNSKLGGVLLVKLRDVHVLEWRSALGKSLAVPQDKSKAPSMARSASALNRDMGALRAALNFARRQKTVSTDAAWSDALKPVKNADRRREVYLDREQRRRLIDSARKDLAPLLHALSLVPLRPGAMAKLIVKDFDARLHTLRIGKDKAGGNRTIKLPLATSEFFAAHAKNKLPAAPLLARAEGKAWDKDSWYLPFKEAVRLAGLPDAATVYALRHSTITDLISLHRLDTMTVAKLSGTSVAMIEKNYAHLLQEHAAAALANLAL